MTDNYKEVKNEGRKVGRNEGMKEKTKAITPKDQFSNMPEVSLSISLKAVALAQGHASPTPNYVIGLRL